MLGRYPLRCLTCDHAYAEHRCAQLTAADCRPEVQASGYQILRPYVGPMGTGSTSSAPWCGICQGWHLPGYGPCTANYSASV